MVCFRKLHKIIDLIFLFSFFKNFSFSIQDYYPYRIELNISDPNSCYLNIKNEVSDGYCEEWIPSLISPLLLLKQGISTQDRCLKLIENFNINTLFVSEELELKCYRCTNVMKKYNTITAIENFDKNLKFCYFGLSATLGDYYEVLNESLINLNMLKNNDEIKEKVFSFNKWETDKDPIITYLYLGDYHENFILKNGTIGSCKANMSDLYWGCSFKKMKFNNMETDLIDNDTGNLYKIYFSSENHDIIFPESFKENFTYITNGFCTPKESDSSIITCKNLFETEKYFSIKLINENMTITIEIDNVIRFTKGDINKKEETRIKYVNSNYFILPLIMFKNFHVQFDANNNLISFFTTDSSILEVNEQDEQEHEEGHNNNSSTGLKVFLIILIIVIILALGYGIFWFIKRRKNSVEKNINKYNKFEDEDNFKDMSEKRVF